MSEASCNTLLTWRTLLAGAKSRCIAWVSAESQQQSGGLGRDAQHLWAGLYKSLGLQPPEAPPQLIEASACFGKTGPKVSEPSQRKTSSLTCARLPCSWLLSGWLALRRSSSSASYYLPSHGSTWKRDPNSHPNWSPPSLLGPSLSC